MAVGDNTVSGIFLGAGVECPQMRLTSGEQISLSGAVPEAAIGEKLTFTGRWALISKCMQGREFRVEKQAEEQGISK